MGRIACTEHRCDSHIQKKTLIGTTGPVNGRCGSNSTVEYWKSNNSSSFNFSDIKTCSGGSKKPSCSEHGAVGKYEGWTTGQSSCVGHRTGKGTDVSATNDEIIIYGGRDSFIGQLYYEINVELERRRQHNIYKNLSDVTTPSSGSIIDTPDLNSAIDTINAYANVSNTDVTIIPTRKVSSGNIVKKTDFNNLKQDFNSKIVAECICYSDCQAYYVCYCYGNCKYY